MRKNKNNQAIWSSRIKKDTPTLFQKVGDWINIDKKLNKEDIEVIVVNDGSDDDTYNILEELKKNSYKFKYRLINLSKNFGKGYAVKQGAEESSGKYILLTFVNVDFLLSLWM